MPTTTIGTDVGALRAFIEGVENLGFEHVITYDHVLGGPHEDRRAPLTGPYTEKDDFHEPFTFFAWTAALTTRLRLFPSVIVAPQRQTALMAKQAVELHNLSGGRLRLGIGVGWNWVEFDALNAEFEGRGKVVEEQVAVMRELWSRPLVTFSGEFHNIDRAGLAPLPLAPIPVWFGGYTEASFRRSAALGDGHVFGHLTASAVAGARRIASHADALERPGIGLHAITDYSRPRDEWITALREWREVGGTHVAIRTMPTRNVADSGCRTVDDHLRAFAAWRDAVVDAGLWSPAPSEPAWP
ncbi:MAG: TIGR03619 family F420-dependent LLM class oxidoreductase [Ilumatobacteraceae bacterium]